MTSDLYLHSKVHEIFSYTPELTVVTRRISLHAPAWKRPKIAQFYFSPADIK